MYCKFVVVVRTASKYCILLVSCNTLYSVLLYDLNVSLQTVFVRWNKNYQTHHKS